MLDYLFTKFQKIILRSELDLKSQKYFKICKIHNLWPNFINIYNYIETYY